MISCCRELVKRVKNEKKRAQQAKQATLAQRKENFGTLQQVWFNRPEDLGSFRLKEYIRPYSRTQGAIDSLTFFSWASSDKWEAYLWQITISKTHSVSSALLKVLDGLPAQVTSVVMCFVVPTAAFAKWKWLQPLPKFSDCSPRVRRLMQTIRQEVLLLSKEMLQNPKKSMSPPNTGSTTPVPDDDIMEG